MLDAFINSKKKTTTAVIMDSELDVVKHLAKRLGIDDGCISEHDRNYDCKGCIHTDVPFAEAALINEKIHWYSCM